MCDQVSRWRRIWNSRRGILFFLSLVCYILEAFFPVIELLSSVKSWLSTGAWGCDGTGCGYQDVLLCLGPSQVPVLKVHIVIGNIFRLLISFKQNKLIFKFLVGFNFAFSSSVVSESRDFESRPGLKLPGYKTSLLDSQKKLTCNTCVSLLKKRCMEDA